MNQTAGLPPPTHKRKKADKAVSFRPDIEAAKALKVYCVKHGVKPGEVAEHFLRLGLGLAK